MKSRIMRHITKATIFAAALLAVCFSASTANAQGFKGKFTLPYEVRWGRAVLAPGDYQLTFTHDPAGDMIDIQDAKSLRSVALEQINDRQDSTEGASALLIRTEGKQRVVYSLRIVELGEAFVYEHPPANGRAVEEAHQTQTVPVLVAKK